MASHSGRSAGASKKGLLTHLCLHDSGDPQKSVQDQLPLIVGSASAGLVVIVAMVVIAVVCLK